MKVTRAELVGVHLAERFQRDIARAARLIHPRIVQLYDSGVEGHTVFFKMQMQEDESLRERLARTGPMKLADVLRLADELVSALDYAHQRGVGHRDVKPENILLTAGGERAPRRRARGDGGAPTGGDGKGSSGAVRDHRVLRDGVPVGCRQRGLGATAAGTVP